MHAVKQDFQDLGANSLKFAHSLCLFIFSVDFFLPRKWIFRLVWGLYARYSNIGQEFHWAGIVFKIIGDMVVSFFKLLFIFFMLKSIYLMMRFLSKGISNVFFYKTLIWSWDVWLFVSRHLSLLMFLFLEVHAFCKGKRLVWQNLQIAIMSDIMSRSIERSHKPSKYSFSRSKFCFLCHSLSRINFYFQVPLSDYVYIFRCMSCNHISLLDCLTSAYSVLKTLNRPWKIWSRKLWWWEEDKAQVF